MNKLTATQRQRLRQRAAEVIASRMPGVEQLVPPGVLDELAFLADSGLTPQIRRSAGLAIQMLRDKGPFRPILEIAFASETVEELAGEFRRRRLLPDGEVHDAIILAETVLLDCDILLTSDEHLRAIDHH
jgi:hypothetical protein